MWYEILPSFGILFASFLIPNYAGYIINQLAFGNPYKRDVREPYELDYLVRDFAITGDPYKQQGLEGIPDEDEKK